MIKKGTISQFEEIDISAAQNEASNFGFYDAYQDWKANTTNRNTVSVTFTWFVAGIIVGKKAVLDELNESLNTPDAKKRIKDAIIADRLEKIRGIQDEIANNAAGYFVEDSRENA